MGTLNFAHPLPARENERCAPVGSAPSRTPAPVGLPAFVSNAQPRTPAPVGLPAFVTNAQPRTPAPVGLPAFVTNAQPRATHTADDSDTVNSRVSNVQPRATRRTHTAEYKLQILAEADACRRGKIGELLRREGLCYSHLAKWRGEREAGTLADRLVREYAALKRKLKQADAIIEAQKNLARLLERDMASAVMVRMESQS